MIANLVTWLILAALVVFFIWLAKRALKNRRWFIRWPGLILSGLLALITAGIMVVGAIGLYMTYVPVNRPVKTIQVNSTPEMVTRGQHLADVFCTSCHSPTGDLPLIGGVDLAHDLAMPIGSFVAINLTPAGPLKGWSDGEIARVLREGIGPDGRRLLAMGSIYTRYLSDDDLMALLAYLRSQPAVANETRTPADQPNFLGVLIIGAGSGQELPPVTGSITAPAKADTAEYGKYLMSYQDCRSCHGPDLSGGKNAFTPNGPGLRLVRGMTQDQFISMMRNGVRPDGHQLQAPMPWKLIGRMDDTELSALYKYLISIP